MQLRHDVLRAFGVNLPGSHWRHDCWPGSALYEPGKHGDGSAEPTAHDVPAGQVMQSLVRLDRNPTMARIVWSACVPPGHGCGADEPAVHR